MLTPYAAQFVREQLQKKDKCLLRDSGKLNSFAVDQNDCVLEVSQVDCSCQFRKSMLLPCSHIFAVRKKLSKDLFCATLWIFFYMGYRYTVLLFRRFQLALPSRFDSLGLVNIDRLEKFSVDVANTLSDFVKSLIQTFASHFKKFSLS